MTTARTVVEPFGDRAWLVRSDAPVSTAWVLRTARRAARSWPDAEVVPGLDSVLIIGSVGWSSHDIATAAATWPGTVEALLQGLSAADADAEEPSHSPGEHRIPVRYDGPDLAVAAAGLHLSAGELAARHARTVWTVAAVGFSPGFGYLTCHDPLFAEVQRRSDPRPRVPAGSVALAAGMCAVYPSATPGGWQLVGTTETPVWGTDRIPPALLRVGDVVRFEALDG